MSNNAVSWSKGSQTQGYFNEGDSTDGLGPFATPLEQLASKPLTSESLASTPTPLDSFRSSDLSPDGEQDSNPVPKDPDMLLDLLDAASQMRVSPENRILFDYRPTGAGKETASQLPDNGADKPDQLTGVPASEALIKEDMAGLNAHREVIEEVAREVGVPPALIAAIISRESRSGKVLNGEGWGDPNEKGEMQAFGVMQIDIQGGRRIPEGQHDPWSKEHLLQGAKILKKKLDHIQTQAPASMKPEDAAKAGYHPDWPLERQWQGAVVAYNGGVDEVRNLDKLDVGTTGNDYSNDTWARGRFIAQEWALAQAGTPSEDPIVVDSPFGEGGSVVL